MALEIMCLYVYQITSSQAQNLSKYILFCSYISTDYQPIDQRNDQTQTQLRIDKQKYLSKHINNYPLAFVESFSTPPNL